MTLGTTIYPSFDPSTALFAGDGPYRHRAITINPNTGGPIAQPASGVASPPGGPASAPNASGFVLPPGVLPRGTLLGRIPMATAPGSVVAAPSGNGNAPNTGNGTLTPDAASPVLAHAKAGAYAVKFSSSTAYDVYDPDGRRLASGAVGGPAYADQLKFAVAAGATAFAAGDTFSVTVAALDAYGVCVATATDGSQVPAAILAADTDTSGGAVVGPAYFAGDFAFERLFLDPSWATRDQLDAALRQAGSQLYARTLGIQEDVL